MVRSTETARRRTRNASGEISAQPPSALRPRPATTHPATGSPGVRCGDRGGVRLRAPTAGPPRARAPVLRRPRRPPAPPAPRPPCRVSGVGRRRSGAEVQRPALSVYISLAVSPRDPDSPGRSARRSPPQQPARSQAHGCPAAGASPTPSARVDTCKAPYGLQRYAPGVPPALASRRLVSRLGARARPYRVEGRRHGPWSRRLVAPLDRMDNADIRANGPWTREEIDPLASHGDARRAARIRRCPPRR